ncbi:MAG: hypothetical protein JXR97_07835, partial [Planctomycetes bacterium]|nr:hypothetical protein [Planctomycetota bacterium]
MEAIRYEHIKFRDNWVWRSDDGESCYRSGVIYGQVHYSELSGSGKPHHIQEVSSVLEAAYREGGLAGKEFIRIADYSKLKHASLTTRKAYAKLLNDLNEKYDCHPVVTYICGASFFARNAMRLFAAFVRQKFIFLDSVEDAFARIRDNLDLLPRTPISAKDIIFKDEWRYENKESGYGYSFGIVPGRLFYYQRKGKATLDEVKQVFESVLPRIMQESEFDNRSIDFIWEISGREGLSMPVRRYIFRSLQSVQKRHNAKLTNIYICGKRGALYVVMNVLAKALGVKICFVPTFEDALARMAGKVSVGKVLPSHERLVTEEHIQEIDDYFGQLLFAGEEIPLPPCPVSPDNPLNSLKELIDAARVDLQELRENDLRLTKTLREEIRERERSEA